MTQTEACAICVLFDAKPIRLPSHGYGVLVREVVLTDKLSALDYLMEIEIHGIVFGDEQ